MTQDDLTPWQDTPFVQALTSAATADELSGENAALAAFQSSTARRRRRVVRFLGTGATSIALVGVVGGGVAAAAYTRSLPSPVQDFAHDVLGPIGIPAPVPHKQHKGGTGDLATAAGPSAAPSPEVAGTAATATPVAAGHRPPATGKSLAGVGPRAGISPDPQISLSASPTASASATPAGTPSASPTAAAGDPSTWTISASASSRLVHVHDDVQVTGTLLDARGEPVADHRVVVRVHVPGTRGATRAAIVETDANGDVSASLTDLTSDKVVVLAAGNRVHSQALRIVVKPTLSVAVSPSADGTSYIVTVTADGGQANDVCTLLKRTPQGWQQVGQAQLDSSSSASFAVQAPRHPKRFVVRLPATSLHAGAAARLRLTPP